MGFYLVKFVTLLIMPPASLFLLIFAGLVLMIRERTRKCGYILTSAFCVLFYLLSTGMVSGLLLRSLENRYPPLTTDAIKKPTAVVVLGGSVSDQRERGTGPELSGVSLQRLFHGVRIKKMLGGDVPLILSGGDPFLIGFTWADASDSFLTSLDFDFDDLIVETRSRNTFENAQYTQEILKPLGIDKIVLVTSASHMPRAAAVFRKAGVQVVPAPTGFRSEKTGKFEVGKFVPSAKNLEVTVIALHEYLGLLWYTITGYV